MSGQQWKGALGGAGQGAAMGTMISPGIGTAIGAGIGGIAGYFMGGESDPRQDLIKEYRNGYSSFRENQKRLIDQLDGIAQGRGPSVANMQMNAGMGRNTAGMAAAAQSGRGNVGAMAQNAMAQGAAGNAQIAEAGMAQGVAERQRALELYGLNVSQARQMDEQRQANAFQAAMGSAGQPGAGDRLLAAGLAGGNQYLAYRAQQQLNQQKQPQQPQSTSANTGPARYDTNGGYVGGIYTPGPKPKNPGGVPVYSPDGVPYY